jgi:hypothetical protein
MTSSWSRTLTRWGAHKEADAVYDLSHLHPLRYTLSMEGTPNNAARDVEIRVGFSSHTFTESCEDHEAHIAYSPPNDPRKFSLERYELSKRIPQVIQNLKGRNILFGNRENYLVVELPGVIPPGTEYWIFFDLRPVRGSLQSAPNGVLLFVQSAYVGNVQRPPYGSRPKRIGFNALVGLTLQGRKPQRGP